MDFAPFNRIRAQSEDVYINVVVTNEIYYEITASPGINEVGMPISFTIMLTDQNGDPVDALDIVLNLSSSTADFSTATLSTGSDGEAQVNFTSQLPGLYSLTVTGANGNLELVPLDSGYQAEWRDISIPILGLLPEYSNASNSELYWTYSGLLPISSYEYYVEVSESPEFDSVTANSGWINELSYDFSLLPDGREYYFRVKARNPGGVESDWSIRDSTVYDITPPVVIVEGIEILENEGGFRVEITVTITDNLGVSSKILTCVGSDGETYECATESGFGFTIDSEKLHMQLNGEYFGEYEFCVQAYDLAGNESQVCDFSFTIDEQIQEKPGIISQVANTVVNSIREGVKLVEEALDSLNEEQLQTASVAASGGALVISLWFFSIELAKLPYILAQLIANILSLLGLRVKGKPYGFVYDSVTKEPLAHCIVRIYDAVSGKLVRTDVTDVYGAFTSRLDKGSYKIVVNCGKYKFPSVVVVGRTDFPWENVYHGETITLDKESEPNLAIPLDPINPDKSRYYQAMLKSRFAAVMKIFLFIVMLLGFVVSIYLFRKYPNFWNFAVILLYMITFVTGIKTFLDNPLKFGVVESIVGRHEPNLQVGLKELEFDRIISKRVTDENGLYRFVVPPGKYKLEVLEEGIDMAGDDEKYIFESKPGKGRAAPMVIAKDVVVRKPKQSGG
ncbi:hypothetical protein GF357_03750 [Candidatus Dojkabacteria bacterium]|nr:hypothetical protein [Candidatus Dojkabacteria bacterium]